MDDSRDLPFELSFDWNDEAVAAHCDQLILRTAAIGKRPQRPAQAVLNRPVLPFHRAADPPQLRRGIVVEAAVRLDLAAEQTQQGRKVVLQLWRGERGDSRPFVPGSPGKGGDEVAPRSDTFDDIEQVPYLDGFKCCPFNTCHFKQGGWGEQAADV